jgi:PilZ domain
MCSVLTIDSRRSQRVALRVAVTVLGAGTRYPPIYEKTKTFEVNAHGALLSMKSSVAVGQLLTMRHDRTDRELLCKVARVDRSDSANTRVGIEFLNPSPKFWRLSSPPIDWNCPIPSLA